MSKGNAYIVSDKIKKGKEGEDLATQYLERQGFEILERNFRHKRNEIDLIARKNNWLVFVEVKYRASAAFGYPEDFVDYKKARNVVDAAVEYQYKIGWKGNVRYDIVSVLELNGETEVKHFEDAFY